MTEAEPQVRAAGGAVWRRAPGGGLEWAVVHRPRYDDWSLPKGKLEEGETLEEAALREVAEETGLTCNLGAHIGTTRYLDQKGRTKTVDYWLMDAVDGDFVSGSEVDELRWLGAGEAADLLTHEHDRDLLAAAVSAIGGS